jgi:hypothetical protein
MKAGTQIEAASPFGGLFGTSFFDSSDICTAFLHVAEETSDQLKKEAVSLI